MRVLLVEDDDRVSGFIARGLREQSFAVDVAADGADALERAAINTYDVVILDLMIPKIDGVEVCRRLRADQAAVPVLMLTARDAVADRIAGLDAGADDYLTKPFAFGELIARIRALLRRAGAIRPPLLGVADLVLDTQSRKVWRAGHEIPLTTKEYALLEFFVCNAGRVVGRAEIAEHVWDESYDPFTNVIEVYVNRLRRKIDEPFDDALLQTRRGAGYILTSDGGAATEPD